MPSSKSSGLYLKGGIIYLRYYDPSVKKGRSVSTKQKDTVQGWQKAREFKANFYRFRKESEYRFVHIEEKTFEVAYKEFLETKDISEKSKQNYREAFVLFQKINGNVIVADLKPVHFDRFVKYLRDNQFAKGKQNPKSYSDATIDNRTRSLVALSSYLLKNRAIPIAFARRVSAPPKPVVTIPPADLKSLLESIRKKKPELYHIIYFLYITGLRVGEAVTLTWDCVNYKNNRITIRNHKAGREEHIPITDELRKHLITLPKYENTNRIFIYKRQDSLHKYYALQIDLWGEKRYTIHQLRKTFVTHLLRSGIHLFDVKTLARHKEISTTLRYYSEEELDRMSGEINKKVKF